MKSTYAVYVTTAVGEEEQLIASATSLRELQRQLRGFDWTRKQVAELVAAGAFPVTEDQQGFRFEVRKGGE